VVHQGQTFVLSPQPIDPDPDPDPDPEPPPLKAQDVIAHLAAVNTYAPPIGDASDQHCINDVVILPTDLAVLAAPDINPPSGSTTSITPQSPLVEPTKHPIIPTSSIRRIATIRLLQHAANTPIPLQQMLRLHIDGGTNRSVTNHKEQLIRFKNIKTHYMSSAGGELDIICTGIGYIPWRSQNGQTVLIKCYYSPNAPETIVSPSDIVLSHFNMYHSWTQHADMSSNKGYIKFINHDTEESTEFPLVNRNNLWYYINDDLNDFNPTGTSDIRSMIHRVDSNTTYMIMHARLGHPGKCVMQDIHNHVDGINKLRKPALFKCGSCILVNATKYGVTQNELRHATHTAIIKSPPLLDAQLSNSSAPRSTPSADPSSLLPGQVFQIDTGFVRSTKYQHRAEDGHLVTSLDGFNGYVIVVDRATRYTWLFLTRTKIPPVELLRGFLRTHGTKQSVLKWVRTDKGGELWGSHAYQKMLMEEGFIPEPTASDVSFQNGVAERPNCTLADMMRSLLHCAQLGPEYWSWAVLHATYLKNRLPHHAIHKTPYEAYKGNRPSLKHLRIFGSPVTARNPGRRPAKLDVHASHGIFLGYTATDHNVYYLDSNTKKVKISMHVIFDEAGYTLPPSHQTVLQQHLHLQGSNSMCNTKDQPLQNDLQSITEESADGSTQGTLEGST
jgi:hypothetical protein